jgi:DNA-directed RNA polymerase specialized sigma24 family protein
MTKHNNPTTAAAKVAGTPETSTLDTAVTAWRKHWSEPDDYSAYCRLAEATSNYLAERYPFGSLAAPLKGREKDVQEEALLLMLNRYLHGNPALIAATACGSSPEVSIQFARVAAGAWRSVVRELEKELWRNRTNGSEAEYLAAKDDMAEQSPHLVQTFWGLPVEMQLQLVFAGLRVAARERRLPRKTTDMVTVLLTEEGLTPSKLARRIGVTPQAVYQRLKKAGTYLKKHLENQEFGTED